MSIEEIEFQKTVFTIIVITIPIAFAIIGVIWYNFTGKVEKNKENEKKEEIRKKGEKYNAIYSCSINHISGLPLAENSNCIIHLGINQITVEGTGEIFKLQRDKILDMNVKTSKEIQNSISGAVGGYLLLGPIGAFLNGSTTEFHRFLLIIYKNKSNNEECMSFDIGNDIKKYNKIQDYIERFKSTLTNKHEVEL